MLRGEDPEKSSLASGGVGLETPDAGDMLLPQPLELTGLLLTPSGVVSLEYVFLEFRTGA